MTVQILAMVALSAWRLTSTASATSATSSAYSTRFWPHSLVSGFFINMRASWITPASLCAVSPLFDVVCDLGVHQAKPHAQVCAESGDGREDNHRDPRHHQPLLH